MSSKIKKVHRVSICNRSCHVSLRDRCSHLQMLIRTVLALAALLACASAARVCANPDCTQVISLVRIIRDYIAPANTFSLRKGTTISIFSKDSNEWETEVNGGRVFFPSAYADEISVFVKAPNFPIPRERPAPPADPAPMPHVRGHCTMFTDSFDYQDINAGALNSEISRLKRDEITTTHAPVTEATPVPLSSITPPPPIGTADHTLHYATTVTPSTVQMTTQTPSAPTTPSASDSGTSADKFPDCEDWARRGGCKNNGGSTRSLV